MTYLEFVRALGIKVPDTMSVEEWESLMHTEQIRVIRLLFLAEITKGTRVVPVDFQARERVHPVDFSRE